jgi:excisionase family DNA binding protein
VQGVKRNPDSLTVSVRECAAMLGIAPTHCYKQLEAGEIPARRLGTRWIISRRRIEDFIDGKVEQADERPKLIALPR